MGLAAAARPRTVAVRHVTGHRLVALIEIVSPANKDRLRSVEAFATKAPDAPAADVYVLVADLLPPGRHDPFGMNAAVWQRLEDADEPAAEAGRPAGEPLTVASYDAGPPVEAYLEYLAAGAELPDMPLFLRPGRYVNVPSPRPTPPPTPACPPSGGTCWGAGGWRGGDGVRTPQAPAG